MECTNCKEDLSGQENFCSNCGQKNIEKLNVKYILGDFLDNYFNLDSKLFLTLKYLILKPGLLSKEYMDGKRIQYVPAIRLYIVLSVIYFFLISVIDVKTVSIDDENAVNNSTQENTISIGNGGINSLDSASSITPTFSLNGEELTIPIPISEAREMDYNGTLDQYLDSITQGQGVTGYFIRQSTKATIRGDSFGDIMLNQVSLFLLLFIPLLALVYATCFSRNKYGYIGHLIFNLHFNSFVIFLLCINQLTGLFILPELLEEIWTYFVIFVPQIYLILAIILFYERKWWEAIYKYFLLLIGYSTLAILFFLVVIISSIILT
jgi:Protein of unknown function (DUF3667)